MHRCGATVDESARPMTSSCPPPGAVRPGGDRTVAVGIDGSAASIAALRWAVTEAVGLTARLRLISVVNADESSVGPGIHKARSALRRAVRTVHASASCQVQTGVRFGDPAEKLLEESLDVTMLCIGAKARAAGTPLSPLAVHLATHAHCPIAVIQEDSRDDGVVAVAVNDDDDNNTVVRRAMWEGRIRHATVRQVDMRRDSWVRRFPDVHVETVGPGGVLHGQCGHLDEPITPQLAVVGLAECAGIAGLVTPNCQPIAGYPDCSVLFVRS